MRALTLFCLLASCLTLQGEFIDDTIVYGKFPTNFIWAAATASYQVEGAWNVDGHYFLSFIIRHHLLGLQF